MIKFKGPSSLRPYMPVKLIKRDFKAWIRIDESNFVCEFQIYTGKINSTLEKELGPRVIKDITRNLVGKGHTIYFNNYFNSVPLEKYLMAEC